MEPDLGAERAVLAGCCTYGADAYVDVADFVSTSTFSDNTNQVLWACVEHLLKDNQRASLDYPSLMSAANSLGLEKFFEKTADQAHVRAILNMPIKQESVRKLGGKIRKLEITRKLAGVLSEAKNALREVTGDESIGKILNLGEGPVLEFTSALAGNSQEGVVPLGQGATAYIKHLLANPRQQVGISTGMRRYDKAIGGGLRAGSVDVIAGRMKEGKSQIVDNSGRFIAETLNLPVLNVDTEMEREEHIHRVLANMAGVLVDDIETGHVSKPRHEKLIQCSDKLETIPYSYLCCKHISFEETLANIRRWVIRKVGLGPDGKAKPCVVIYDYLKLVTPDSINRNVQEHQSLGFMATSLKNFMSRYGVACLCFAQVNRQGIIEEDTDVIAGSDRIGWFCTSLSLFKKKTDAETAEEAGKKVRYTHKLKVLVARHGKGLARENYINIQTDFAYGRLIEGPTRDELALQQSKNEGVIDDGPQDEIRLAA